jgi:hypothetical protein
MTNTPEKREDELRDASMKLYNLGEERASGELLHILTYLKRLEAENKNYEAFLDTLRDCANEKNKIIAKQAKVIEEIKNRIAVSAKQIHPDRWFEAIQEILSIINAEEK